MNTRFSPTVLSLAVLAVCSGPVQAYTKCDISGICAQTAMNEGQTTRNRIQQMQEVLAQAIDTARRDIVTAIGQLTQAVTGSASKNAQTIGDQQAALQVAAQQAAVKADHAPLTCSAAAASQGPASGGTRTATRATGRAYQPGQVDTRWAQALAVAEASNQVTMPPKEPDQQAADTGVGLCRTFADPNDPRGAYCAVAGAPAQRLSAYANADIKAGTLMDGPALPGATIKNLSVPATGAARDARNAYLAVLGNVSPPSSPEEAALKTPQGKAYMGLYTEYRAAKSLANYPAEEYDRLTTVDPGTVAQLNTIAKDNSAFLQRYYQGMDPATYQKGVSPLTMMDIEVERRIGNPDWLVAMAAADANTKAAEQLMINAYSLRLQRDQLMATLQNNVLLGKLLNNSVEQTYRPQIDKLNTDLRLSKAASTSVTQ